MGSRLNSSTMTSEMKSDILKTLGKLKQTVLWKFEGDLPGKPDNVIISEWMPQMSILAHPNLKLFITHGGHLSLTEAASSGVPLIVIPIFEDQYRNAEGVVERGYGVSMDFDTISEEVFTEKINQVLDNPEFEKKAKHIQKLFHDRPMSPQELVNYYAEFVIRTGGVGHLSQPEMCLASRLLLDVMAVIVLPSLLVALGIVLLCKKCLRKRSEESSSPSPASLTSPELDLFTTQPEISEESSSPYPASLTFSELDPCTTQSEISEEPSSPSPVSLTSPELDPCTTQSEISEESSSPYPASLTSPELDPCTTQSEISEESSSPSPASLNSSELDPCTTQPKISEESSSLSPASLNSPELDTCTTQSEISEEPSSPSPSSLNSPELDPCTTQSEISEEPSSPSPASLTSPEMDLFTTQPEISEESSSSSPASLTSPELGPCITQPEISEELSSPSPVSSTSSEPAPYTTKSSVTDLVTSLPVTTVDDQVIDSADEKPEELIPIQLEELSEDVIVDDESGEKSEEFEKYDELNTSEKCDKSVESDFTFRIKGDLTIKFNPKSEKSNLIIETMGDLTISNSVQSPKNLKNPKIPKNPGNTKNPGNPKNLKKAKKSKKGE